MIPRRMIFPGEKMIFPDDSEQRPNLSEDVLGHNLPSLYEVKPEDVYQKADARELARETGENQVRRY